MPSQEKCPLFCRKKSFVASSEPDCLCIKMALGPTLLTQYGYEHLQTLKSTLELFSHCFVSDPMSWSTTPTQHRVTVQIPNWTYMDSTLYAADAYAVFDIKDLMHCFSIHYAVSIVMAVWLDIYFFVWLQNGYTDVFYNGLLL